MSFKSLVLSSFPELTVKRDPECHNLFMMFNKNGETFSETMASYSAKKTWEIAHRLMLRGELQPYWKEESERSLQEAQEKLAAAKMDPDWQPMSETDVTQLVDEVLKEYGYK